MERSRFLREKVQSDSDSVSFSESSDMRYRNDTSLCLLIVTALSLVCGISRARAQEMEPRAYSASPTGANFLVLGLARSEGSVLLDPSLPVTNVEAKINTASIGYQRTFGLAGRSASLGAAVPYLKGTLNGDVGDEHREISRSGLGDLKIRFAANLLGGPALTAEEFAQRSPSTTLGTSFSVAAPTGQYDPKRLINIGSNRWAFKPEIGLSNPIGNWFSDASAGVWLYTDNSDFFGGKRRSQDPLSLFQLHAGYSFRPRLWLAADTIYAIGSETHVNGVAANDQQRNLRYGLTLSLPLTEGYSLKLAWSNALTTRIGGRFDTVSALLQYNWVDN